MQVHFKYFFFYINNSNSYFVNYKQNWKDYSLILAWYRDMSHTDYVWFNRNRIYNVLSIYEINIEEKINYMETLDIMYEDI